MTIFQCMLVALLVIPVVYIYHYYTMHKQFLDNVKEIVVFNYLFLMCHCSIQYDGDQVAFSAKFMDCEVLDDYAEPLQLLIENCVKEHVLVLNDDKEGVPHFNRTKLLAKMKERIDNANYWTTCYSNEDFFTRLFLTHEQSTLKAYCELFINEYEEINSMEEQMISYY